MPSERASQQKRGVIRSLRVVWTLWPRDVTPRVYPRSLNLRQQTDPGSASFFPPARESYLILLPAAAECWNIRSLVARERELSFSLSGAEKKAASEKKEWVQMDRLKRFAASIAAAEWQQTGNYLL
jgi:hypothetical protein